VKKKRKPVTYLVSWHIELDAESPRAAAALAREILLDPTSSAVVFCVEEHGAAVEIDLLEVEP
jgi:hypothetical protein